ncbi:MAG TPA: acetylxylan esterase [Tepidisphaeraceae bacterium]|nr:acetylxylan esterase [Tepidisphaeraceae bacterium]
MRLKIDRRAALVALLCLAVQFTAFAADTKTVAPPAVQVVAKPAKATGVYEVGEKASWEVSLKGEQAAEVKELSYTIRKGGLTVAGQGKLDVSSGKATLEAPMDEPNAVLVEIKAKVGNVEVKQLVGAVAGPGKIGVSEARPTDFDAFWEGKIAELAKVPVNAKVEAGDSGKADVEYAKVTLDNVNGTHVYGQLAKPKKAGKFPALLLVQYAGVYGLKKDAVVKRGAEGWLALNIMAHDLPLDQPEEFYKKQSAGPLKDYMSIGAGDRNTSYFLRMYLGCYRAADYLASRDDWDGKTLVVYGTSQGGQQAIVTAGIHPKITAMLANVPAGCDVTAAKAGRAYGFPYFANYAKWKNDPKILEEGRYFDAMNFAPRITCPAMVSMGLIDETCPPAGVLATCNQMKGKVETIILPLSNHHGTNNGQAEFWKRSEAWLRELRK